MLNVLLAINSDETNLSLYLTSFRTPVLWALVITAIGLGVVVASKQLENETILAAAPAIGVVSISIVMSNIGIFTGARQPLLLIIVLVGIGLLLSLTDTLKLRTMVSILPYLAVGFIFTVGLALSPFLRVSDGQVLNHPTTNHDALYYASNQAWVGDHAYTSKPKISQATVIPTDQPGASSAVVARTFNVRQGDAIVSAFLEPLSSSSRGTSWFPSRTTWLFVSFSILFAACLHFGIDKKKALLISIAVGVSWQPIFQTLNQNAPAVIGFSLLPAIIALAIGFRKELEIKRSELVALAVLFCALMVIYSELLILGFIAFIIFWAVGNPSRSAQFRQLVIAGLLTLCISPYSTYQAVKTNIRVGQLTNSLGEPIFWSQSIDDFLRNLFGVSISTGEFEIGSKVAASIVVLGLVLLTFSLKSSTVPLFASSLILVWLRLGTTGAFYSVDRFIQTLFPTILWLSLLGLGTAKAFQARLWKSLVPISLMLLLSIAGVLEYLQKNPNLDWRTIDGEFVSAVAKISEETEMRSDLFFHSSDYLYRLWAPVLLYDSPKIEYSTLSTDYYYDLPRFEDNQNDKYLISDVLPVGRTTVLKSLNNEFKLFDMRSADAALLVGVDQSTIQSDDGHLLLVGNSDFRLTNWSNATNQRIKLRISGGPGEVTADTDGLKRVLRKVADDTYEIVLKPGSHQFSFTPLTQTLETRDVEILAVSPD